MVQATEQVWQAIKKHPQSRFYLHGYIGHPEVIKQFTGCWFGFNSTNLRITKVQDSLKIIPQDKILVESDGCVNPQFLQKTILQIAKFRGWSIEKTKNQLRQNAIKWLNNPRLL